MPPNAYMQQLARALRFRDRYAAALANQGRFPDERFNDLEDSLLAAYTFTWHVKDWIYNDPSLSETIRSKVVSQAERSEPLLIVADLANGTKHYLVANDRTGAADAAIELQSTESDQVRIHHVVSLRDGRRLRAIDILDSALNHWRDLLIAAGLDHFTEVT